MWKIPPLLLCFLFIVVADTCLMKFWFRSRHQSFIDHFNEAIGLIFNWARAKVTEFVLFRTTLFVNIISLSVLAITCIWFIRRRTRTLQQYKQGPSRLNELKRESNSYQLLKEQIKALGYALVHQEEHTIVELTTTNQRAMQTTQKFSLVCMTVNPCQFTIN
jgi:hypothetical protein